MTILVCGSEGDWALLENTLSSVGHDTKRRGSVAVTSGQQMFKTFTGTDDVWVHIRMSADTVSSNQQTPVEIRSAAGAAIFEIRASGSNSLQIARRQTAAGAAVVNSETFPFASQEWHNYDIRFQRSTVTNTNDTLVISFYRDEVLRFQETNTDPAGWPTIDQILLTSHSSNNTLVTYYQDVVVTNAVPTVGMELATLVPSATGNYSQFTNNYTNIDDEGYNASDTISTAATGQRESWVFSSPTFNLGNKVIYGVVLNTVAQTDTGNVISDFRPFLRISGVDYDAATNLGANNAAPNSFVSVFTQNPQATAPWTAANLSGLEAGIRSV